MAVPPVQQTPPDLPPELAHHPRYRILKELGRGGMGVVYQAEQTMMDRRVAVKVINKALLDHPDALERFHREVRAAAKLTHPNIVIAHDAERVGDLHMLVMEYVEGQSLAQVVKRKGPLAVAHACHFVRQAALGLQHAFDHGMVHRDIKPQNLMLTPKGQVKILDFGLAKVASERGKGQGLTSTGAYMGTPDYCAPEQATDARGADIRADIYSLGCTLYCLLAGRPPFDEPSDVLTILAHLEKEPRPLPELRPDVPEGPWAVVRRMLAKAPAERYQKPVEVAQALVPFIKQGAKAPPAVAAETAAPSRDTSRSAATKEGGPFEELTLEEQPRPRRQSAPVASPARPRWWLLAGGGAAAAVALALGAVLLSGVVSRTRTPPGPVAQDVARDDAPGKAGQVGARRAEQPAEPLAPASPSGNLPKPDGTPPAPAKVSESPSVDWDKARRKYGVVPPDKPAEVAPAPVSRPAPEKPLVSLFNGRNLAGWTALSGQPARWKVVGGVLQVAAGTGDIMTTRSFGPHLRLRAEFRLPYMPDRHGQARANSGIFLLGRHEIQIVDDVNNNAGTPDRCCGALYGVIGPSKHVTRRPWEWQQYDIDFRAPRFNAAGELTRPGRLTVWFNSTKVIDDVPFSVANTLGAPFRGPATTGPIVLQDHNAPVQFRNIQVEELPPAGE